MTYDELHQHTGSKNDDNLCLGRAVVPCLGKIANMDTQNLGGENIVVDDELHNVAAYQPADILRD